MRGMLIDFIVILILAVLVVRWLLGKMFAPRVTPRPVQFSGKLLDHKRPSDS